MTVYIVVLGYDIMFNDADEGSCFAGNGQRIVRAFAYKKDAELFVREWTPVVGLAEKETIVFPRQQYNRKLYAEWRFDLHSIDDGERFHLDIVEVEVEDVRE